MAPDLAVTYEVELTAVDGDDREDIGSHTWEAPPMCRQIFILDGRKYQIEMIIHPRNAEGFYMCDVKDLSLVEENDFEKLMKDVKIPDSIQNG